MTRLNKLSALAAVVALSGGLAACGGGSSSTTMMPMEPDPEPMPTAQDMCEDGGGSWDAGAMHCVTVAGLFTAAQEAKEAATTAGTAASDALEAAAEADDLLSTTETAGDSSVAMMNAQAILDANAAVAKAVTDAKEALDAAEAAQTAAMEHHPDNVTLAGALEDAVEEAMKQHTAAMEAAEDEALAMAVAEVTAEEDAETPVTPRSIANMVGMDIAMALLPTSSTDGSGIRHTDATAAPVADDVPEELRVEMDDRVGMTWAEIVGDTMKMRIATAADATNEVDAASIAGMSIASGATPTDRSTDMEAVEDDGSQVAATYKGIAGTAFCAGSDCYTETDADVAGNIKFNGSWYFTPSAPMAHWVANADDTGYVADELFASFGHWLVFADQDDTDPTNDTWTVHTFALSTITARGDLTTVNETGDTLTDTSAKYSGPAVGMSVLKTDNAAGDGQDIDSGRFTATVNLTATFAAAPDTPMLKGYVSGFEGSAVNEDWMVTLNEQDFSANITNGAASATGRDGVWTASAYGVAD
ncbi:MAG: hypothetical protein J4G15_14000 [Alphaproteobacteria bacterium]|nr:hypothetical protein [Alphaproteobacteria bacterium]